MEEAAKTVADELTQPRPLGEEKVHDIQVLLNLDDYPASVRTVKVCDTIVDCSTEVVPFLSFRPITIFFNHERFLLTLSSFSQPKCLTWSKSRVSSSLLHKSAPRRRKSVCNAEPVGECHEIIDFKKY